MIGLRYTQKCKGFREISLPTRKVRTPEKVESKQIQLEMDTTCTCEGGGEHGGFTGQQRSAPVRGLVMELAQHDRALSAEKDHRRQA